MPASKAKKVKKVKKVKQPKVGEVGAAAAAAAGPDVVEPAAAVPGRKKRVLPDKIMDSNSDSDAGDVAVVKKPNIALVRLPIKLETAPDDPVELAKWLDRFVVVVRHASISDDQAKRHFGMLLSGSALNWFEGLSTEVKGRSMEALITLMRETLFHQSSSDFSDLETFTQGADESATIFAINLLARLNRNHPDVGFSVQLHYLLKGLNNAEIKAEVAKVQCSSYQGSTTRHPAC